MTSLAERLLGIFLGELEDQLVVMNADLIALEVNPDDTARLRSLFRVAHTLKGAAAAVSVDSVAQTCHSLETMLASARDQGQALGPEEFRELFAAADSLAAAGRELRGTQQRSEVSCAESAYDVAPVQVPEKAHQTWSSRAGQPAHAQSPQAGPAPHAEAEASRDYLRIDPHALDAVLASVEQILVAIDGVGARARQAGAISDLARMALFREAREERRRSSGGTPVTSLAAGPTPGEVAGDLRRLSDHAKSLATDTIADARTLASAGAELATRARMLRMRPFSEATQALPRIVRDLATAVGKDVRLHIVGGDVQADRVILDGLREALVHLVRNAIDHGIETPDLRASLGKPREAVVTVAATVSGDSIVVTVEDDGAGLDLPAIRASLARLGREAPADDAALVDTLFKGGVSTRTEATTISGRGVGLDLVREAVARIHGTVHVTWFRGRGTSFTLQSPLTLARIRALLVKVGTETVALPTSYIERVRRISPAQLRRAEGNDVLLAEGNDDTAPLRVTSLARLLGAPLVSRPVEHNSKTIVLNSFGQKLAVIVDELMSEQSVIVRSLTGVRVPLPHLSGVAILPGGRIALVANVPVLLDKALEPSPTLAFANQAKGNGASGRRVLVVDDSITTRMLQQSVLEAAGYEVRTAVDGIDALEILSDREWDLVVSDVEMPRMDGFALCAAIRGNSRLARTRVVLVTALEKDEHRARGLDVGADAYIGKSSFDQRALLETIEQLFG